MTLDQALYWIFSERRIVNFSLVVAAVLVLVGMSKLRDEVPLRSHTDSRLPRAFGQITFVIILHYISPRA